MMEERRKRARAKRFFAVNIVSVDSEGHVMKFDDFKASPKYYDESGLDFTPDGAKIMCSKPLPAESRIQMKMLIPDNSGINLMKANGTIKWFKQVKGKHKKYFIMGVFFQDMTKADKSKLTRLWRRYGEAQDAADNS